jgi:hypothetical protein
MRRHSGFVFFSRLQGVFYAGMEFRDFPFDEQNLNINFWLDTHGYPGETLIRLIPSATSVSTAFEETVGQRKGNDVNGWTINAVTLNTTLLPLADAFLDVGCSHLLALCND